MLLQNAAKHWWVFLIRGLAAILFGFLAWFYPLMTLSVMVIFFGAWALVDGVFSTVAAIRGRKEHDDWWLLLLSGIFGILIGGITFVAPGVTEVALLLYISAWAMVTGVLQIFFAIKMRKEIKGEFWLMLGGLASIVFGVLMLWHPLAGALAVVFIIAAYALFFGVFLVMFSFKVKGLKKEPAPAAA